MALTRSVEEILVARPTVEGAGVRLKRAFGHAEVPRFDPFLMLDDFHSHKPADYLAGFPWHPHRGIETITYVLHGRIEHRDSLGNSGVIGPGDAQWMTAGSGIIHQEMPTEPPLDVGNGGDGAQPGLLWGLQLWANLPAAQKMMPPRYREVKSAEIPWIELPSGVSVGVLCGELEGIAGPVRGIAIAPEYLDVALGDRSEFTRLIGAERTVFAYVLEGEVSLGEDDVVVGPERVVLFGPGEQVVIKGRGGESRLLLISGRPLGEPVAWGGPIVMNTEDELRQAMREYREGTFIRHPVRET